MKFTKIQRENAKRWDRYFYIGQETRKRPVLIHEDDLEIGNTRKKCEAILEDRKLQENLKEVWE